MSRFIITFIIWGQLLLIYLQGVNSFYLKNNEISDFCKNHLFISYILKKKKNILKNYVVKKYSKNKLSVTSPYSNERNENAKHLGIDKFNNEECKNVVKDIQGVWKFYLPMFVMDTEFKEIDNARFDDKYERKKNEEVGNNEVEEDSYEYPLSGLGDEVNDSKKEFEIIVDNKKNKELQFKDDKLNNHESDIDDLNLNLLRGERLYPLPLFVYNYEHIYSASDYTYAYWFNKYKYKNIYDCTIKLVNKMNSKYMIILHGYLFISPLNSIKDKNIRLRPSQVFGNIFLVINDSPNEKSLIPPNTKIYDKKGNEVKDVLSILEKKNPEFKKDKKKIENFLGLKNWKHLGIVTGYKTMGEGENIFHIDHMLTRNEDNRFYNIMDFDTINNNYKKKNVYHIKDIFNSFFEQPSTEILSAIIKQLQEKSANGPF